MPKNFESSLAVFVSVFASPRSSSSTSSRKLFPLAVGDEVEPLALALDALVPRHLLERRGRKGDRGVGGAVGGHGAPAGRWARACPGKAQPIGCISGGQLGGSTGASSHFLAPPGDPATLMGLHTHSGIVSPEARTVQSLDRNAKRGSQPRRWLLRGLAARLGACALVASVAVSTALTLLALRSLPSPLAHSGIDSASLSRWAWTTNLVIVLGTTAVTYALAVWHLRPLLGLAEGARRLASGEAGVRVDPHAAVGELRALSESFNHMARRLDETHQQLERRNLELTRANEVLELLSATDGLTQLYNHRHFQDAVRARGQARRADRRAALPGAGGRGRLQAAERPARPQRRRSRAPGDRAGDGTRSPRDGLPRPLRRRGVRAACCRRPSVDGGAALAEKVRGAVEALEAPVIGPSGRVQVTVSIGLAVYAKGPEATFDAADRALYEAKAAGKNRVVIRRRPAGAFSRTPSVAGPSARPAAGSSSAGGSSSSGRARAGSRPRSPASCAARSRGSRASGSSPPDELERGRPSPRG